MAEEKCKTCPFHREEVLKRKNQKEDIQSLEKCVADMKAGLSDMKIAQALAHQEIGTLKDDLEKDVKTLTDSISGIKKPLWAIGSTMLLLAFQTFMKALPAIMSMGGGQ